MNPRALEITDRWRRDLAFAAPEMQGFRWGLITEELEGIMTDTHTTSGGAYYATAVQLREDARRARLSYPEALARLEEETTDDSNGVSRSIHARHLSNVAIQFELAAALYCVAQAIEDCR